MSFRRQIRRYAREFAAVGAIIAIGIAVSIPILVKQRFTFPWEDFYEVEAEFETAQAVTPGQGQTVNVAGVEVGEIQGVELEDGRAVVRLRIEKRYAPIYRDARMLLRPRTGLKDMQIQVDPGHRKAGAIPEGGRLPASNTAPDVNPDEVLAALDADTRASFKLLTAGLGEGLEGRGRTLRRILRAGLPTAKHTARLTRAVSGRRRELARLVHNLRLVARAAGRKDAEISRGIDSTATTLEALASEDASLSESLDRLPRTLATTESVLRHGRELAGELRPAAVALRPTVRQLGPALQEIRPLLRDATPILRDRLRPLVRDARPVARDLRPAARDLQRMASPLHDIADDLNYIVNETVYDPPGKPEGYLYYLSWFFHNSASLLSVQDAHGVHARGLGLFSCSTLDQVPKVLPELGALTNLPDPSTLPAC